MSVRLSKKLGAYFRISLLISGTLICCIIQWSCAAQYQVVTPGSAVQAKVENDNTPFGYLAKWEGKNPVRDRLLSDPKFMDSLETTLGKQRAQQLLTGWGKGDPVASEVARVDDNMVFGACKPNDQCYHQAIIFVSMIDGVVEACWQDATSSNSRSDFWLSPGAKPRKLSAGYCEMRDDTDLSKMFAQNTSDKTKLRATSGPSTPSAQPTIKPVRPSSTVEQPSPQSYGNFTAHVKKGVTTQSELVELFGGPNISTLDADGTETWVYEKTSSHSETVTERNSNASGSVGVQRLDVFFGNVLVGSVSGPTQAEDQPTERTTVSRSIKTLTVIIKFNKDKTVREYSSRAAYF